MARITYLERRVGTYYARIDIPGDLVSHYSTTTRKKSLRTKEEAEAKRRLWPVIEAWRAEFEDVRSRREITPDDMSDATWQHYIGTLDRDDQERRRRPTQADIDEATGVMFARAIRDKIDVSDAVVVLDATLDVQAMQHAGRLDAERRSVKLADLRKHLAAGETALVNYEVEAYVSRHGLIAPPGSPARREIALRLLRAEIEALERTLERDRGDYTGAPRDPIIKPVFGNARETAKPGERIMELFEVFARENPKGVQQDRLDQCRRDINSFVDMVGPMCPVHRIDKRAVREWKRLLMQLPVKATETTVFKGLTLAQIVQKNRDIGKPVVTPRTVNRYLSSLGAFSSWLVAHGYLDANPCADMFLAKEKKVSTLPFSTDQLNALFRSPLFVGCQNPYEWRNIAKPGNHLIRDHRYWVPLIMLFSGARPGEIAQLAVADVREMHGHWIMHITTEGDGDKSVKTEGSKRVIPIHPELIALGLLKHHEAMKIAGEIQLFPEAKRNSRGQMIAEFSREFGRYLTRLGMKNGRGLSLYSFRHGATDAWRRAGHLDDAFGFMLGHTSGTMTGRYGILPQGALALRVELIQAISYPTLQLEHLHG